MLEQTLTAELRCGHAFRKTLSLDLLVDFWREESRSNHHGLASLAREMVNQVDRHPELQGAITDLGVLDRHHGLVNGLLTAVLPPGLKVLSFSGVAIPASFDFIHVTERFQRELLNPDGTLKGRISLEMDWDFLRVLFCYLSILRRCYGMSFAFEKSVTIELTDPETGLDRFYQLRAQFEHSAVRPVGELPVLPPDAESQLAAELTNLELWKRYLPPEKFEYYGLTVYEANDVTEELTMSLLKQELVEQDPLISVDRFKKIELRLRSLLNLPDLRATVIGLEGETAFKVSAQRGYQLDNSQAAVGTLLSGECRDFLRQGNSLVLEDLSTKHLCSPVMHEGVRTGAQSMLMCPLEHEGQMIGLLILSSPHANSLNALTMLSIKGALPLFTVALRRTSEAFRNRIQSVMKEKFTAIHPAVEWRFREAASRYARTSELVDITFPEVFPLFGSSDIRASSTIRNETIKEDLLTQIGLARRVIQAAYSERPLAFLESREFRLCEWVKRLEPGLLSGDEARIIEFLQHDIEGLFSSLEGFGPSVLEEIGRYRAALDQDLGFVFDRRQAYEDSVNGLTDQLAELLTAEQEKAQAIFPHYFQMYKTDGVDHTIYIGNPLTERNDFDLLYLRNLRLWQLTTTCLIARLSRRLEEELPMALATAHLVLAQRAPISLRYSLEEKKFSVDGAYNTRYEIIKKRIDKAEIRGTQERLTQPGMLAVVYSHPDEAHEYREYFEYLASRHYIITPIEDHALEDLPGVSGLRALRVAIAS